MSDKIMGTQIPDLQLSVSGGDDLKLPEDFKGKWTLLYFYPKDDTPGCTKQACGYRDNIEEFKKLGVNVYGVSGDNLSSHSAFMEKFTLNFPLIFDQDYKLSEALGAFGEQEWQGKKFKGISRDTFAIDSDAKVAMVWRKVDPTETIAETLNFFKSNIR